MIWQKEYRQKRKAGKEKLRCIHKLRTYKIQRRNEGNYEFKKHKNKKG